MFLLIKPRKMKSTMIPVFIFGNIFGMKQNVSEIKIIGVFEKM